LDGVCHRRNIQRTCNADELQTASARSERMSFSFGRRVFMYRRERPGPLQEVGAMLVLRFLRTIDGLSQADLSFRTLMRQSHISAIETKRINPTPAELQKLARALGVANPSLLLEEVPDLFRERPASREQHA
jgi:hypothetical protein